MLAYAREYESTQWQCRRLIASPLLFGITLFHLIFLYFSVFGKVWCNIRCYWWKQKFHLITEWMCSDAPLDYISMLVAQAEKLCISVMFCYSCCTSVFKWQDKNKKVEVDCVCGRCAACNNIHERNQSNAHCVPLHNLLYNKNKKQMKTRPSPFSNFLRMRQY